jgi:tetratricopeptide (TPR) repeat protein
MFVFLSLSFVLKAQKKIKLKANEAFNLKDYKKAIKVYTSIFESNNLTENEVLNLATSYYKTKDYKNTAKTYNTYLQKRSPLSLMAYNQYLQSLKLANYSEADITEIIKTRLNSLPVAIIERYNIFKDVLKKKTKSSETITSIELKNLNTNSNNSDFGLTIFPDSTVMYSSTKENKSYNRIYKKRIQPFINIYSSKLNRNNGIDTLIIEKYVNESMMHSSSPLYDPLYKR